MPRAWPPAWVRSHRSAAATRRANRYRRLSAWRFPFRASSEAPTHFCGVATGNVIYCWGLNALVDTSGHNAGLASVPTQLQSTLTWTQVATGASHTCALTADQDAYCWGSNQLGQLGTRGDTTSMFKPTLVYGGFKFSAIAAGVNHVCALTPSHDALCWGSNQSGQLGDGTGSNRVAPTLVTGGLTFQSIGAGDPWTCALSTAGKPYCWGAVQGVGTVVTPHGYDTAPVFVSLAVGSFHACALTGDGSAYCWGNNQFGQLGDSTTVSRTDPTRVVGGIEVQVHRRGSRAHLRYHHRRLGGVLGAQPRRRARRQDDGDAQRSEVRGSGSHSVVTALRAVGLAATGR